MDVVQNLLADKWIKGIYWSLIALIVLAMVCIVAVTVTYMYGDQGVVLIQATPTVNGPALSLRTPDIVDMRLHSLQQLQQEEARGFALASPPMIKMFSEEEPKVLQSPVFLESNVTAHKIAQ